VKASNTSPKTLAKTRMNTPVANIPPLKELSGRKMTEKAGSDGSTRTTNGLRFATFS
jgi:hypothetical protein